jgi:hypothetical protein
LAHTELTYAALLDPNASALGSPLELVWPCPLLSFLLVLPLSLNLRPSCEDRSSSLRCYKLLLRVAGTMEARVLASKRALGASRSLSSGQLSPREGQVPQINSGPLQLPRAYGAARQRRFVCCSIQLPRSSLLAAAVQSLSLYAQFESLPLPSNVATDQDGPRRRRQADSTA